MRTFFYNVKIGHISMNTFDAHVKVCHLINIDIMVKDRYGNIADF